MSIEKQFPGDTKKVFMKMGTCSRTFCYLLDREFGHLKESEERAADPLAGGIMLRGHQCGMLWGCALAAGAESFRRYKDQGMAVSRAVTAAQHIMESFTEKTKSANCREITGYDMLNRFDMIKFMVKFFLHIDRYCFKHAEEWAPEAIRSANEGLSNEKNDSPHTPVSCASEVVKKMGASDEQAVMVAGFAGGLGLSGNGCGALAAAIWMNTMAWNREQAGPYKTSMSNPKAKNTLKAFYRANNSEFLCYKITGQRFNTLEEHTKFIKNGGCKHLIDALAFS
ncbi:MAG: C_GCAxxG_C_C family protein [Spirochaetes bacterium]|nr:C_GCAxxG_C_C family protein [Spirochaetota bacterium]